jgi:tRNA U34 5-methylaminomethyl-2-thiouridine-forming methyltransferase MnmC
MNFPPKSAKVTMRNGDAIPVMAKGGEVIHYTWNMSLPHVEFVRRTTGQLPKGAWVGTVSKLDNEVMAITSKYFFDYQLPAPPEIDFAVKRLFE